MPRMMRIQHPGALYHVINCGNYKSAIFASDGARNVFLKALGEAIRKHEWKLHAYVIMRNHYHVALDLNE
jgi:REP element-mobilizing transposase RayT